MFVSGCDRRSVLGEHEGWQEVEGKSPNSKRASARDRQKHWYGTTAPSRKYVTALSSGSWNVLCVCVLREALQSTSCSNLLSMMQAARIKASTAHPPLQQSNVLIDAGFAAGQLRAAVAEAEHAVRPTATERLPAPSTSQHARKKSDQDARGAERAAKRVRQWTDVMHGMATGALNIGSRKPVEDFPVWVTPEVVSGGFASGQAAAGGPLKPHEAALAQQVGVPEDRGALAGHYMSDDGVTYLRGMLDTGGYKVFFPHRAMVPSFLFFSVVKAEFP
jgi:hypothetical protein